MDSKTSDNFPPRQLRRSTRQSLSVSSAKAQVANYGPTPRSPLKRAKKSSTPQPETPAVNGTNDNDSDDEESPKKKSRLQAGDVLAAGDGPPNNESEDPMETQDESEEQEGAKGLIHSSQQPINPSIPGPIEDVHLKPLVMLGPRCALSHAESESVIKHQVNQPKIRNVSPAKHSAPITPTKTTFDSHHVKVTSMNDYKRKMEAKIQDFATEASKANHNVPSNYPRPRTTITRQRTNDSSTQKTGVEKRQEIKTTTVARQKVGTSSTGYFRYFWQLVLLMLLTAGLLLAFKHLPTLQKTKEDSTQASRSVDSGLFVEELTLVAQRFPSQRPELWKRSKIHLQKHLDLPNPTEPVSMILTAGARAQKTLFCLAHNIASAFSSALNASVVVTDGATQSKLDSDQVKMDIDTQLKAAFGGDKLAAVVHRFEELPPGSTLIFYRYCDHETAAFKRAFMLFTVLLSVEDLSAQQTLKEVEEMVRDHVEERFVGTETAFNKMDADKFSGLWSRIAHLILPVVYEDEIEQKGCESDFKNKV